MKPSLPLLTGILVILIFGLIIASLMLWKPMRVRWLTSKLDTKDPKKCAAAVEDLLEIRMNGKCALIDVFPDGEDAARFLADNWNRIKEGKTDSAPGESPFMFTVGKGWVTAATAIIGITEDPDYRNGGPALCVALQAGDSKMAETLLAIGADVSWKGLCGWTPLHFASAWGFRDIAETLIDRGADVNAASVHGWTPLDVTYREYMIEFLRARGGKSGKIFGLSRR